ncbi:MAG: arsenic resistance protein, partial [Nitrososphaera sp.]
MSAGVLAPAAGLAVEPYLLVWLGALLFLNLLRLNPADLAATFASPKSLAVLAAVKLVALPLALYGAAYVLYQPLALPVLLVAGISTGLGAPFVANIAGARLPLIVGMIMATSLAAPFVLPALVYALVGSQFAIPVLNMITLLAAALFIPLAAGWAAKRWAPSVTKFADRCSFLLSIVFVVLINMGMFSRLSWYFFVDQAFLLQILAASFLAYGAFGVVGFLASPKHERAAGVISMTYVNNTLVMVFAAQFFGPQVAALAAIYNVPYYVG